MKVTAQNIADINFVFDAVITQTIGLGSTAVGRVITDSTTGVIKYWQDRTLGIAQTAGELPEFGNTLLRFQNSLTDGANGDFIVAVPPSTVVPNVCNIISEFWNLTGHVTDPIVGLRG